MPSRDGRTPSFCSERMRICQKHLTKVYSRSKNLLVTARAGKVVPEVTGSAARGYSDVPNHDGHGLSKFEKKKLSPYLNAVAGLFDGPSLLKQFQLRKLRTSVVNKNFRTHSRPDCPQSCNESTSQDQGSIPVFSKGISSGPSPPSSEPHSDIAVCSRARAICGQSKSTKDTRPESYGYNEPMVSSNCATTESMSNNQAKFLYGMHPDSNSGTLNTILTERGPVRQIDNDLQLQAGVLTNSSLPKYKIDDLGKWNLPSYLSNFSSEQRILPKSFVPRSLFPPNQHSENKESMHKIYERHYLPGSDLQQRAVSTTSGKHPSQSLPDAASQRSAVSYESAQQSAVSSSSGWNASQLSQGAESKKNAVSPASGINHSQKSPGSKSKERVSSTTSTSQRSLGSSTTSGRRNPPVRGLQHGAQLTASHKIASHAPSATQSQKRGVSTTSARNSAPSTPPQQGVVSTSDSGMNNSRLIPGDNSKEMGVSTSSPRSFSKMLKNTDLKQKAGSTTIDNQEGTFASRLSKKMPRSGNVLQASVASLFGTSLSSSKPIQTLSVAQLHDAICDHSKPDCPNFKKDNSRVRSEDQNASLLVTRQWGAENPPQADALSIADSTKGGSVDDFAAHPQEIVSANEKCAKYAIDVKTDMKRQEKSSANLWKYGSMAVCTENPGRDYRTGQTSPDPWELMAKERYELGGIHWSRSGSRKVVSHVCQILKQNKWGQGAIDLLDSMRGNVTSHCVNAVLQQQKDPQVCLAFFNWVKRRKGYKHDVFAFTTMINVLGRARNLRGVRHMLEDMHTGGIEPTVATYNTLILCYGRVESLNESLRVFRIMQEAGCKPDNVTYSILIHLCIKAGYLQEALKLYQGMLEAGVQPDTITYSVVIDSLGKSGNLSEARKLFREMKERGCVPNEFTYNSMINRHAQARKTQHALKYFNEMRGVGFKLNAVTCTTMMSVLGNLGKFEEAERLFFEMQQGGITADTAAYSLMINMWGNSGDLDKAVSWYGRMLGNLVTPSLSVFSSLVNAHLESNLYQAAQHFLTSMGMWGIEADLKLYTILLRHSTVCEKQEHADAVLGIMDRLGHPAHRFLYELLTAKNQDRLSQRSRVEAYFDSVEKEVQTNKQAFANALIEFLHKLQCKTDPGLVWEIAMEKGLYPSAILRREAPNHWLVDLHSMSVGTALVALPRLLVMLKDNWMEHPTKRVYVVTGWGKRSRVTGSSAMKQAVSEVLEVTGSPFSLDNTNAGVFVCYGRPFCEWIARPSTLKKLGLMGVGDVVV